MKIVIISDLHGNYDALRALPESYDELWVLGDLVNYGPQPAEVVGYVAQKAAITIRGNHDHSVGFHEDPRCTPRYRLMAQATGEVSDAVLADEQKQFLRDLPVTVKVERQNTRFHLVHAMPSNPLYGYCPETSDLWISEVADVNADILLVGHTHTPFVRRIGNRTVVNPGSLGQPKTGNPDACYAVWENGSITLKTYAYPVEQTVEKIQSLAVPSEIKRDLITVLRTGSP
ncbi:MAG: metallophosphoesterase family protein [Acidobacteria bacterium]|nr:metallophosphoesterase family protein [Acidobacteriota bacterium]